MGIFASVETPSHIVELISSDLRDILTDPGIVERFQQFGHSARVYTTVDFSTYLQGLDDKIAKLASAYKP